MATEGCAEPASGAIEKARRTRRTHRLPHLSDEAGHRGVVPPRCRPQLPADRELLPALSGRRGPPDHLPVEPRGGGAAAPPQERRQRDGLSRAVIRIPLRCPVRASRSRWAVRLCRQAEFPTRPSSRDLPVVEPPEQPAHDLQCGLPSVPQHLLLLPALCAMFPAKTRFLRANRLVYCGAERDRRTNERMLHRGLPRRIASRTPASIPLPVTFIRTRSAAMLENRHWVATRSLAPSRNFRSASEIPTALI